jgi:cytochrome b
MTQRNIKVWDWPTRLGHWLMVIGFTVAYFTAESERWRLVHVLSGSCVMGVVSYRIIWGFIGSRYALFSSFIHTPKRVFTYLCSYLPRAAGTGGTGKTRVRHIGHNPAGGWAVVLLLLSAGLAAASGILAYHLPDTRDIGELHEWLADSAVALVAIHLVGVLVSSLAHRENLVVSMLTGSKKGKPGQGISSTHVVAAVALCMWIFLLTFFIR